MPYRFTIARVEKRITDGVHDGYDISTLCERLNDAQEIVGQSSAGVFLGSDRFDSFPPDDIMLSAKVITYMEDGLGPTGKTLKETMMAQSDWSMEATTVANEELASMAGIVI